MNVENYVERLRKILEITEKMEKLGTVYKRYPELISRPRKWKKHDEAPRSVEQIDMNREYGILE